jgi:hypothetical protein
MDIRTGGWLMHNATQTNGQAPEAGIKVSFELFPPKTEQGCGTSTTPSTGLRR